jgi:hypothetical protein
MRHVGRKVRRSLINHVIEFKKRLPEDGLRWIFSRIVAKKLYGRRMDMDITICDEQMDLVCSSKQVVLVLDAKKRYNHIAKKVNL